MSKEAAERLRSLYHGPLDDLPGNQDFDALLDAALAAERKATVERIRAAALATNAWGPNLHELLAILDAEAARET